MCKFRLSHRVAPLLGLLLFAMSACNGPKLATADAQMERGEYFDASKSYRKIYNALKKDREKRRLRGEVAFKMAEAHRMLSQTAKAGAAYQNAITNGYADSIAWLRLAQMLHAQGKYPQAAEAYLTYLSYDGTSETALAGLSGARNSVAMKATPTRHRVKEMKLMNSSRSDFAPALNGDVLYFTTTNEKSTGAQHSEVTGMKRSDIWMAKKDEQGRWLRPVPVEGELNSEMDEGIVSFSPDGTQMYLSMVRRSQTADSRVEIAVSRRSDAAWGAPAAFEIIPEDTVSSFAHPSVSPSGEWLYFTTDKEGGFGGKDLWRVSLTDEMAHPYNLGPAINTWGNEMFPYAASDSVLYFASDGHPGMGGLDLFRAVQSPDGTWRVANMGFPINSPSDDFGIVFEPGGKSGYFSSNRNDARGYDRIYSFELPDIKISLSGSVTDMDEYPIASAVVRLVGDDGTIRKTRTRDDGTFDFGIDPGVNYVMLASAEGYLNARQQFASDTAHVDAEYGVEFMLASFNKPNIVENIFYDFNKASLRPESRTALDGLARMLRDAPSIAIKLAAHTDRVGSDRFNQDLSERRARSVVDYLTDAGIDPERLSWQGYGKSRPMTVTKRIAREYPQFTEGTVLDESFVMSLGEEDRAAADQINRRTEFEITAIDRELPAK